MFNMTQLAADSLHVYLSRKILRPPWLEDSKHCVCLTLFQRIWFICALNRLKIRKMNDGGGFPMTCHQDTQEA